MTQLNTMQLALEIIDGCAYSSTRYRIT